MMTDPLWEVEQQIRQLMPLVLVGPALLLTVAGLIVWLAGIRLLKIIAALMGAAAGLFCAWRFTSHQIVPMVLFAVIAIVLCFFLHKPAVVMLAGLLTFGIVVFFPAMQTGLRNLNEVRERTPATAESVLDLEQSINKAEELLTTCKQWLIRYLESVPGGRKSIAYMAALAVVGIGLFSWRLVCGATCAVLGILLMSMGMILLLFYKGAQPLLMFKQNWLVIAWILAGMCIIGTLIQYWISPKKKCKQDKKVIAEGGSQ